MAANGESYMIRCGAVMPGCKARFVADTEAELLATVAAHASAEHQGVELTDDVVERVKDAITRA